MFATHPHVHQNATGAYQSWLRTLTSEGLSAKPRGIETLEVLNLSTAFLLDFPIIRSKERKLNFSFMAAEPLWYLSGSRDVEDIAQYNSKMRDFSDDGVTFFGAYGPRIIDQLPYVIAKLQEDVDTRQAVLTTWLPNPPGSKDVPCTVALVFNLREECLNLTVFMRSSDAWLGVPYDWFSFSMIAAFVACQLKRPLGAFYFTAVSAHLYCHDLDVIKPTLDQITSKENLANQAKDTQLSQFTLQGDWDSIFNSLAVTRDKTGSGSWRIRG